MIFFKLHDSIQTNNNITLLPRGVPSDSIVLANAVDAHAEYCILKSKSNDLLSVTRDKFGKNLGTSTKFAVHMSQVENQEVVATFVDIFCQL